MARRIHLTQDLSSLLAREPFGQKFAFSEIIIAYLRTGNVESFCALRHILFLHITLFVRQINEHFKGDHLDAKFGFILLHIFLRVIWTIKWLASGIISGSRMIA